MNQYINCGICLQGNTTQFIEEGHSDMQQHGWTLRTSCYVKYASCKQKSCMIPGTWGTSSSHIHTDGVERWLPGLGEGGSGEFLFDGHRVSVGKMKWKEWSGARRKTWGYDYCIGVGRNGRRSWPVRLCFILVKKWSRGVCPGPLGCVLFASCTAVPVPWPPPFSLPA